MILNINIEIIWLKTDQNSVDNILDVLKDEPLDGPVVHGHKIVGRETQDETAAEFALGLGKSTYFCALFAGKKLLGQGLGVLEIFFGD